MKTLIEVFPESCDYDETQKTSEKRKRGVIHRVITENQNEINRDTLDKLIEQFPDDTTPVIWNNV